MDTNNLANVIQAKEYTLQEILNGKKYTVDYFQREYSWKKENIEQLIYDLTTAFFDEYRSTHIIQNVANYNTYFMGSLVLSDKNGNSSIIDGQQRITSLTLLLIYLYHATEKSMSSQLESLIYSDSYGSKSFNIQVPEREECLRALFDEGTYTVKEGADESTRNMALMFEGIGECFPSEQFSNPDTLKAFVYWVIGKVILVKITAMSENNAYTIFETMNNRGVSLTSSDMLKGFILSKFSSDAKRKTVNESWKKDMQKLYVYGNDTEAQFFQSWLRSQFADSIRQTKVGSLNMDFENIGTRFHNWFKENYDKGLLAVAIDGDIENFVDKNYKFYLGVYIKIRKAEEAFQKDLEHIYYIKRWGIAASLSYPLLLAPICSDDSPEIINEKLEIVAKYIDSFVVYRSTNFRNFSASSIRYTMYSLVKVIRNKSVEELREMLRNNLLEIESQLNFKNAMPNFKMHGMNKYFIKYFLSRITSYIEEGSGLGIHFEKYMHNPNCKPFEIEHIWCDKYSLFTDEFTQQNDFNNWRNTIGDLILLQRGTNQSYSDKVYSDKMPHYLKENLLAMSLCQGAYQNNPNFTNFIHQKNLSFKEHSQYKKQDIIDRCNLYAEIADQIWGVDAL